MGILEQWKVSSNYNETNYYSNNDDVRYEYRYQWFTFLTSFAKILIQW